MHPDSFLSLAAFAVLSFSSFTITTAYTAAAAGRIQHAAPAPTPTVVEIRDKRNRARQAQIPFQVCPEVLGKARKKCPDCGGDTKIKGYCDTILLNGPQDGCTSSGCGTYCQCDPITDETNGPPPKGQVPFQICRKDQKCSDCGGNDGRDHCRRILLNGPQDNCPSPGCGFYCSCSDDGGSNGDGKTQIQTTTVAGKVVTGTFTATTVTEYSDLRAATTVTTSENGHETALVIFAGGVAWALANWAELGAAAGVLTAEGDPEGSEEDDKACSQPKEKCKDCGGANPLELCSSGSEQNCPCEKDECPTGDNQPKCSDSTCKGENGDKCSTGDNEGCDCKPDDKCPEYLLCRNCGDGEGNEKLQKCKGISGQNDKYKGCDCYGFVPDDGVQGYAPYSGAELLRYASFMTYLAKYGGKKPTPRGNPSKDPKCSTTGANSLVNQVQTENNTRTPKDLLYIMRETLCNDKCENPPDIPEKSVFATQVGDGCEIAISLPNSVEAWAIRETNSTGLQQQECWDSFANATEKCTDYNPNQTGWVNGPDKFEFFQIGYRPKNGDGKKHEDFGDDSELPQYCPTDPKPSCDSCQGGANNNVCTQGDNNGCACEPVVANQPPVPKVTNCATAVAASEIICCGWSKDTQKTCAQKMQGCGITANLDAICQSPVAADGSGTYSVCGQFSKEQGILKGSNMEDIATCLDGAFSLNAQWNYD